jgi:hypothetical protein
MKLVIISDLHDNLTNLDHCLKWCEANMIEAMLFAGDLTNEDTFDHLTKLFPSDLYLVRGNADNYDEGLLKNKPKIINLTRSGGAVQIGGRDIGLCHEPYLIDNLLKKKTEIIFYGHTHKPWQEKRNGVNLVNPGTLGGMFQKATFAFYDTVSNELELKILELL